MQFLLKNGISNSCPKAVLTLLKLINHELIIFLISFEKKVND